MKRLVRAVVAILAFLAPVAAAYGQSTVLQGGSWAPGHVPCYSSTSGQPIVSDCGPARGGNVGLGSSEFLMVARGTGTPPYIGQGTGPLGTTFCSYDAPTNNAAGYHFLCMGANPGQIVYGAGGIAAAIPFCFTVNGAPMCLGGTTGTGIATATLPTTAGAVSCWVNSTGKLTDCSAGAATLFGRPTISGIPGPFTIQGLTARGPPDANNDKIPVYDNASGTIKYVTPGLIAAAATAGVSSIGGVVGPLTLGPNLSMVASQITFTPAGSSGQIQYNNAGALGAFGPITGDVALTVPGAVSTIQPNAVTTGKITDNNVTNIKLATGGANTFKGSLNGTATSDISLTACTLSYQITKWVAGTGWQCGINPVLPSRATAATLDLSAFSAITTQGYGTPGDGGYATFKKLGGGAPFIDSFITTFTVVGGSGYTNGGPYYGNLFSVGTKPFAIGTVTVSGGAFTAANVEGTPGGQCAVGDVLNFVGSAAAVGGVNGGLPAGGSGGGITVTGCSTPLGSFTDVAGNHWQIVTSPWPNALQFGAIGDWNGTDAGTTDNFNAIQAALWYAGFKSSTSFDSGGFWGGRLDIPQGSYMALGTGLRPLIVPNGVAMWGAHGTASTIKFGTAWDATTVQISLGDPNWHFACFNPSLYHMELRSDSGTGYMVYSSCGQDFAGLYQTYIYGNGNSTRPCLHYEKGFGGATVFVIRDVSCSANSNSPQIWLGNTIASGMDLGSTMVEVTNVSAGGNSGASGNHQTTTSLLINGGFVNVNRYHFESTAGGITVDVGATGNGDTITIQNVNGGGLPVFAPCTGQIILTGGNLAGNTVLSQIQPSSTCDHTVSNGQAGGTSYDLFIRQPAYFNPDYTSF